MMERLSIENLIVDENELAEHYKEVGNEHGYKGKSKLVEYLKELKTYKDAEEQGLLLRLPCPIGSDIYRIVHRNYGGSFILATKFDVNNFFRIVINKEIGKTVFLTKEEAEQALAEMEGE